MKGRKKAENTLMIGKARKSLASNGASRTNAFLDSFFSFSFFKKSVR